MILRNGLAGGGVGCLAGFIAATCWISASFPPSGQAQSQLITIPIAFVAMLVGAVVGVMRGQHRRRETRRPGEEVRADT